MILDALKTIAELREAGLKIDSASGYPKEIMDKLAPLAAASGYSSDYIVVTDEVLKDCPTPAQALTNVIALSVDDVAACIKVDDTPPGMLEGRSAEMWIVALLFPAIFLV